MALSENERQLVRLMNAVDHRTYDQVNAFADLTDEEARQKLNVWATHRRDNPVTSVWIHNEIKRLLALIEAK